jgi:ribosomal protein L37AE/L43A
MRHEWKKLAPEIWWCRDCGSVKIVKCGKEPRYFVPRRERERRQLKRWNAVHQRLD